MRLRFDPSRTSLAKAILTGLSANLMMTAAGLATSVITARALTPTDRGLLVALIIWSGVISVIFLVGINDGVVYAAQGDSCVARNVVHAVWKRQTVLAVLGALALALVLNWVTRDGHLWLFASIAGCVVTLANLVNQLVFSILRASGQVAAWANLQMVAPGANLIGLASLWILGCMSLQAAIIVWVSASVITSIVTTVWFRLSRPKGGQKPVQTDSSATRDAKKFGLGVLQILVPQQLNSRSPQIALGFLPAHSMLGIYTVAVSVTTVVQSAATMVEQVLFPKLLRDAGIRRGIRGPVIASVCVGTVLSAPVAVWAPILITTIYGPDYASAAAPMRVLAIAAVGYVCIGTLTAIAKARGNTNLVRNSQIVGLVASVLILSCTISRYGTMAAAVAASASAVLSAAYLAVGLSGGRGSRLGT